MLKFVEARGERGAPPPMWATRNHDMERVLGEEGAPLEASSRATMEGVFGRDFSQVRVHSDAVAGESARAAGSAAYARGTDIVFAPGRYSPGTTAGRELLAHELAHVVQQGQAGGGPPGPAHEAEADRAAAAAVSGRAAPALSPVSSGIQHRVEFRDVGRGEQSGFARLPDIIARLNAISSALTFSVDAAGVLSAVARPGSTESDFDRKMRNFIAAPAVIPLRLTTRNGLLRPQPGAAFTQHIDGDGWASGYVDVDDMLGSDDLGFQVVLIHFLTERLATRNYARRIGTLDDTSPEFSRAHNRGVTAEVELLRDFFGDPTIRLLDEGFPGSDAFRRYRNSRRDVIRARTPPAPRGQPRLEINLVDVRLRNGTVMSAQEYRTLLQNERDQEARRRLLELRGSPRVGPAP